MGGTGVSGEGFRISEYIFSLNKRTCGRLDLFEWMFRFPGWPSFIEVLCFQNASVSGKMITVLRNRLLVIRSLISFPLESGNFVTWSSSVHYEINRIIINKIYSYTLVLVCCVGSAHGLLELCCIYIYCVYCIFHIV